MKKNTLLSSKSLFIFSLALISLTVIFLSLLHEKLFPHSSRIILWAWERADNLSFINQPGIEIAALTGSVEISDQNVKFIPRHQPLIINPTTKLTAVIRIDNFSTHDPAGALLTHEIEILNFVEQSCEEDQVISCQIDFDAKQSEQKAYQNFLIKLRKKLPRSKSLTITALVSWCGKNSWLKSLPVNDAVPMFYRLGAEEERIRNKLKDNQLRLYPPCHKSIGISLDEPLPPAAYLRNKTIYIFNHQSWNKSNFNGIMKQISPSNR